MSPEDYFDTVYREMYDMLVSYAESALGNRSALAEEVVQDTFKLFWMNIDIVRQKPNPRGWLVDTLKNVIRNARRSQARFTNLLLAVSAAHCSNGPVLDELKLDTEYGDLKDNPDYKLLKEFVLEHRTLKEIAQSQGVTVIACKKRIQRAKERLKKYFEKNQN